jgi:hypothetical protein
VIANAHAATNIIFQRLAQRDNGPWKLHTNVPFKGRIKKRKTHSLQIITFGLATRGRPEPENQALRLLLQKFEIRAAVVARLLVISRMPVFPPWHFEYQIERPPPGGLSSSWCAAM